VIRIQDGPASPISPDTDIFYSKLEVHACTDLSRTSGSSAEQLLFAALGSVCLAIAHPGRHVDWAKAQRAYDHAKAELSGCLMLSARDTLGRALAAHRKDPSAAATFGTPPQGAACRPVITGAALVTGSAGSPQALMIVGTHLFEVSRVRIGSISRSAHSPAQPNWLEGQDCGLVTVAHPPAITAGQTVRLRVAGAGYSVTYAWKAQPAVPVDQVVPPSDFSCGLALSTASPSP